MVEKEKRPTERDTTTNSASHQPPDGVGRDLLRSYTAIPLEETHSCLKILFDCVLCVCWMAGPWLDGVPLLLAVTLSGSLLLLFTQATTTPTCWDLIQRGK